MTRNTQNEISTIRWRLDPARPTAEFRVPHFWGLVTVSGAFGTLDWLARNRPRQRLARAHDRCRQPQHQQPKARSPSALTRLFDTDRHPAIRFSSTRVSDAGDGHLSVIGELHAGGGQVTLTLRPALWQVGDRLHVDASVTVDQREPAHALQPVGTLSRNKPVTADDCIPTALPGISPRKRDVE